MCVLYIRYTDNHYLCAMVGVWASMQDSLSYNVPQVRAGHKTVRGAIGKIFENMRVE